MALDLPSDFKEFLSILSVREVRYLLIGGYAVGYHGYPRATNDLDLWVDGSETNVDRLRHALSDFGVPDALAESDLFGDSEILRLGVPPMRLEIFKVIPGVRFEECFAKRELAQLGDFTISLIGLEDLRKNKRATGRHKDLDDLENLP